MDKTDEDAYRPINFSSLFDIYSEGPGTLASMVCQNRTLDFYVLQGGKKARKVLDKLFFWEHWEHIAKVSPSSSSVGLTGIIFTLATISCGACSPKLNWDSIYMAMFVLIAKLICPCGESHATSSIRNRISGGGDKKF